MNWRRPGHHGVVPSDPLAAWALILLPLVGLPALLVIGMLLALLLG